MEMLKKIKWDMIASSVICIALGVILVLSPTAVNKIMTYIIAVCMFWFAAISFYDFFRKDAAADFYRNDLVVGVTSLVIGIVILMKSDLVISLVPIFLGIFIIVSGVKKLQNAIDLARLKIGGWGVLLVLSAVNIVFGVIMVIYSGETAKVITILIGAGLIYSGVSDLFSTVWISNRAKKYGKMIKELDFDDASEKGGNRD